MSELSDVLKTRSNALKARRSAMSQPAVIKEPSIEQPATDGLTQGDTYSEKAARNLMAVKLWNDKNELNRQVEIDAANRRYEGNKVTASKPDTSPIQTYYVAAEGYYAGYTPKEGVIVVSDKWPTTPLRLQNRKHAVTNDEKANEQFNNLNQSDFTEILAKRPKWSVLTKAFDNYTMAGIGVSESIIKRMNLPTAKVLL